MMDIKSELRGKGWYLSDEGVDICTEGIERVTVSSIIQKALNIDQREIADHFLSDDIHRGKIESISGPCVVQIQKVKNASAPKYEYCAGAPPLLRLLLTDGHVCINCLQWGNWKSINLDTPPGTKIYIKPVKVMVLNSFLLLSESQFTVLGGCVPAMVEKWKLCRSLASHIRSGQALDGIGPPPWIPFGKSISYNAKNVGGNFRSLEQEAKEQKEDAIFKQQRLANIAEVSRAKGKVKVFGGGKDKPSANKTGNDIFQRNNYDNNWHFSSDKNHNSMQESDKPNLFITSHKSYKDYNTFNAEKESWRSQPLKFDNHNDKSKEMEKSKKYESKNTSEGSDTASIKQKGFNTTRNVSANSMKMQTNTQSFQKNDQGSSNNRFSANNNSKSPELNSKTSQIKIQSNTNDFENDFPCLKSDQRQPGNKYHSNNEDSEHNFKTSQNKVQVNTNNFPYQKNDKGSYGNRYHSNNNAEENVHNKKTNQIRVEVDINNFIHEKEGKGQSNNRNCTSNDAEVNDLNYKTSQFRIKENAEKAKNHESAFTNDSYLKPGAEVLARYWEDKRFYRAIVHAVGKGAATYVVHFVDYGNYEEVLASDVRPSSSTMWNEQQNSQIPNQGKMHFSGVSEFRQVGYKSYNQHGGNGDTLQDSQWDQVQRQLSRAPARLYQPPHQRLPS